MGQSPVEQAVFASHDNLRMRGYQLVARSPGIDDAVAQQLVCWSPSQTIDTESNRSWGLSFFPIDQHRLAFGRTVQGTPEYSGRGGLQTVTNFLVVTREHLDGFQNNPWAFMLLARSQGLLRYQPPLKDALPTLQLSSSWSFGQIDTVTAEQHNDRNLDVGREALEYLGAGKRVAILELGEPQLLLRWILAQTPRNQRITLSFSIGLPPSLQRPFRLQFPGNVNVGKRSDLSRDGVKLLKPKSTVTSSHAWDRYE